MVLYACDYLNIEHVTPNVYVVLPLTLFSIQKIILFPWDANYLGLLDSLQVGLYRAL